MSVMNKYFPGSEDFDMRLYKIKSAEDYSRLAKQLSCDIREKIKTSYMAYNMNSLEGSIFSAGLSIVGSPSQVNSGSPLSLRGPASTPTLLQSSW